MLLMLFGLVCCPRSVDTARAQKCQGSSQSLYSHGLAGIATLLVQSLRAIALFQFSCCPFFQFVLYLHSTIFHRHSSLLTLFFSSSISCLFLCEAKVQEAHSKKQIKGKYIHNKPLCTCPSDPSLDQTGSQTSPTHIECLANILFKSRTCRLLNTLNLTPLCHR